MNYYELNIVCKTIWADNYRPILMQIYGGNTMLNRNAEKETINILLQENKRLKRENQRLRESLGELDGYKKEYRNVIERLNEVKEVYIERMEEFNQIEKEYRKELDRVMSKRKNIIW